MKSLELHDSFRLWLTSEVHPKFPTILLQSSFKVTYEVNAPECCNFACSNTIRTSDPCMKLLGILLSCTVIGSSGSKEELTENIRVMVY